MRWSQDIPPPASREQHAAAPRRSHVWDWPEKLTKPNNSDKKFLGLSELSDHPGPGYRVACGRRGDLLARGDVGVENRCDYPVIRRVCMGIKPPSHIGG